MQEGTLCQFVAYLACSSLSYQSIRLYLSTIRFLQISHGLPDPSLSSVARLEYVLKGIRKGLPAHSRLKRLPITPYILRIIHRVWSQDPVDHDKVMLWAACCLAFFGFLRCGEFTCPCLGAYSPTMLSPTDIRVDSHVNPNVWRYISDRANRPFWGWGHLVPGQNWGRAVSSDFSVGILGHSASKSWPTVYI